MNDLKIFLENSKNDIINLVENYEKVRNNDDDDCFKKFVSDLNRILFFVKHKRTVIGVLYHNCFLTDNEYDDAFDAFIEWDNYILNYLENKDLDYFTYD